MKKCLVFLLAALLLVGCGKEEAAIPAPSAKLESVPETEAPGVTEAAKAEEPFTFAELKDQEFLFASGAGSWGTWLTVNPDGSFQGKLYDHDNETGAGYPDGIVRWCDFTGRFTQPEGVDEDTCAVRIAELHYAAPVGTVEMKDRMKYVAEEPRGIAGGETFYFYRPSASIEQLPEPFLYWARASHGGENAGGELGFYGFYNLEQEQGFAGEWKKRPGDRELTELESQEEALRTRLEMDETLTQADMNDLAMEIYNLWDGKLNALWGELKDTLDAETMAALTQEQLQWIADKEAAAKAAGEEAGGGSMASMLSALKAAERTRERVYALTRNYGS